MRKPDAQQVDPKLPYVLVTGAGRGLGMHLSRCFRAQGFRVIALIRKTHTPPAPEHDHVVVADFSDLASVERAAADVRRIAGGELRVMVNNAGVGFHGPIQRIRADELEQTFRVNTLAPILLTSRLADSIRAADGSVVMVTSCLVSGEMPNTAVYTASKRALDGFASVLRNELGLRVTCVEPGAIETEFLKNTTDTETSDAFASRTFRRLDPALVARAVVDAVVLANNGGHVDRIRLLPLGQFV